MSQDDNCH